MDNSIKSKFDYLLMVRYIPSSALFLLPSGKRTPPVSEHLVRQCPFAGGSTVFKAEGQTIKTENLTGKLQNSNLPYNGLA